MANPSFSLSTEFVAHALGLSPEGYPHANFSEVTADSRKVKPGSLFVAIAGEKFDGHAFIEGAMKAGASGILCRADRIEDWHRKSEACVFFPVPETLAAYRTLAAAWRSRFSCPVIAVAGSVGKTTTKEILTAILRGKFRHVHATSGSQNGFVGIPLTLLDMKCETQAAVIEVGIDEIGAMEKHMELLHPTHALLTAIGPEHLEKLIDLKTVADEEGLALEFTARNGGAVVVKMDDEAIAEIAQRLLASGVGEHVIQFSMNEDRIRQHARCVTGYFDAAEGVLRIFHEGKEFLRVKPPLPGAHNHSNLLAAVATAISAGLNGTEIMRGLGLFEGAAMGRSEVRSFPQDTKVICDYYNANPSSVEAGLSLLQDVSAGSGARWVVLGDMLELGNLEEKFHRALASKIEAVAPAGVLLYGPRMKWLAAEMADSKVHCRHFASHSEIVTELFNAMGPGDTLLLKGSRGMKMEEIWKALSPQLENKLKPRPEAR